VRAPSGVAGELFFQKHSEVGKLPGVKQFPQELDPDHPRVPFYWKAHLTHYVNLGATRSRLSRLLDDFTFGPLGEVLDHEFA